ncbi:hypothetical protein HaLaN_29825 [Haematococcus lacustris]|uniref:Uncharacterized protein n=1 Tax=Haematococcus lacustris TaxID=44745 RepID=A0A6A0AEY9_HAELA|nr:hypothetical protein HaLaN_29825 [Haematococcus lacustris]
MSPVSPHEPDPRGGGGGIAGGGGGGEKGLIGHTVADPAFLAAAAFCRHMFLSGPPPLSSSVLLSGWWAADVI